METFWTEPAEEHRLQPRLSEQAWQCLKGKTWDTWLAGALAAGVALAAGNKVLMEHRDAFLADFGQAWADLVRQHAEYMGLRVIRFDGRPERIPVSAPRAVFVDGEKFAADTREPIALVRAMALELGVVLLKEAAMAVALRGDCPTLRAVAVEVGLLGEVSG